MYLESLSHDYYLTEMQIVPWEQGYAAMATEDHNALSEHIYGHKGRRLVAKFNGSGHIAIHNEGAIPSDTIVLPFSNTYAAPQIEHVLFAKKRNANNILRNGIESNPP